MTWRLRKSVLWALLAVAASTSGQVNDAKIRVDGAWARRAVFLESGANGAVYATLVNPGRQPDALLAAASDAARKVEIHESFQEAGMMRMRPVSKIDVGAGEKVEMKPGGYHFMLLNLTRELKVGQVVELTLQFQKAGTIQVTAQVK